MLSVIRELAEEAEDPRNAELEPTELLKRLVERGEEALARTPEQLDVLREAGVVDAGGAGLLEIVRGVSAALAGEPLPEAPAGGRPRGRARRGPPGAVRVPLLHRLRRRGRGPRRGGARGGARAARRLAARRRRPDARSRSTSTRTSRAGRSRSAPALGTIEGGRDREHAQADGGARASASSRRARSRSSRSRPASSRSCPGAGNRRLFESYGAARVIEGGQTMNPSTADILAAIEATPATEVLVLPNNSNVILSAEQAAQLDRQAGARAPVALGARRAGRDRPLPARRSTRPRTRPRCSRRSSRSRRAR